MSQQVNWFDEVECFTSFLRELAYFYVPEPLFQSENDVNAEQAQAQEARVQAVRWQIQHVIFPAMSKYLEAPKSLLDRDVVQVAHLPDLYRVFERC